jgi:porphobilinogen synthase
MGYPSSRPRRLRRTPAIRALVSETSVTARQLVLPLFVREGITEPVRVESMPGVLQHTRDSARKAMAEAAAAGVGGVMLYGIPVAKDPVGSGAVDPEGILNVAIADAVAEVGDTVAVMSDLCLDEFTDHGHCGVLDDRGEVDNDATLEIYGRMAVAHASAGAHLLGTSGMMDGQVGAVRSALDEAGFVSTGILAYAAKYASAFYGPFREAVASSLRGDRRAYQQDPANAREAIRETMLDVEEGADIVLVKPALGYLDLVRDVREAVDVPVAAYNVSGEYAMVEAAATQGWIDRDRVIDEIMIGLRRAGADIVLTYWATEVAHRLR